MSKSPKITSLDRVERTASELAKALGAHHGDQFDALVSPDGTLWLKGKHVAMGADARLHELIKDWRATVDAVHATEGAACDEQMAKLYELERETAATRPTTLAGFAIKLLMLTHYGDHDLDGPASGLMGEAEAIAGYAPPATFRRA
jgi:hypothetical protein